MSKVAQPARLIDVDDLPTRDYIEKRLSESGYHQWTGTELVSWSAGVIEVAMTISDEHLNPQGIGHGGVLAGLLDTACGLSLRSLLPLDRSHRTVQMSVTYLKPAHPGRVVAKGRAVHKGRSMGHAEAEATDEAGRVLARATASFMTLPSASG